MNRKILSVTAILVLLIAILPVATAEASKQPPPDLSTLDPGGFLNIEQDLTINVVFVGYKAGAGDRDINETTFMV